MSVRRTDCAPARDTAARAASSILLIRVMVAVYLTGRGLGLVGHAFESLWYAAVKSVELRSPGQPESMSYQSAERSVGDANTSVCARSCPRQKQLKPRGRTER